jgi:hypothetical protein
MAFWGGWGSRGGEGVSLRPQPINGLVVQSNPVSATNIYYLSICVGAYC